MDQVPFASIADSDTSLMLQTFSNMGDDIAHMRAMLDDLSAVAGMSVERIAELRDGLFCVELGMKYYAEANRAIQAGAWFAGTAVAAAALEAVLMAKCFNEPERIKSLPKWKTMKKSYRENFGTFVRSLDLGKLLDIATLLGWFPPGGIPKQFEKHLETFLDGAEMRGIRELFSIEENVGQVCAAHLRGYRNLLHPAVCLRENRLPSDAAGLTGTFVFLIAFAAITERK